jgi:glycosyltransferase involved in cell wall biosynthesis
MTLTSAKKSMEDPSLIEALNCSEKWLYQTWENSCPSEFSRTVNLFRHKSDFVKGQIRYFLKNIFVADADDLTTHLVSTRHDSSVKIAFYCGYLTVGGADRVLTLLANHLTDLGYQIYVITLNQPGIHYSDVYPFSDKIVRIKIDLDHTWMDRMVALAQIIGINVWISNNKIDNVSLSSFPVKFREANIHYVQCDHYSFFFPLSRPETYVLYAEGMKSYERCSVVIACNSFIANSYKFFIDNVATMNNPVSYRLDEITPSACTKNTILCVGRFSDSIKRFDRALLVFSELLKMNSDAQLIVVGRVDKNLCIPATNTETIGEMIERLGFTDEQLLLVGEKKDVRLYYQDASVLLMTSENEAFGMVLVEAGVFGIPSVLFDIPGLEDIIIDKFSGFIVKQNDICDMANKISQLLSNEALRSEIGNNARNRVQMFSLESIGEKWDKLIKLLVTNNDQNIINSNLDSEFNIKVDDWHSVSKKVIREYDRHVAMILTNYSKPIPPRMKSGIINKVQTSIKEYGLITTIHKVVRKTKEHFKCQALSNFGQFNI